MSFNTKLSAFSAAFFLLLWIVLLSGCYTEKKAAKQVYKAHYNYPVVPASFCSSTYPPIVRTKDSIVMKQGETIYIPGDIITDTVTIDCDSAGKQGIRYVTKYVNSKCPDIPVRVDTFYRDSQTTEVDKGAITACEADLKKMETIYIKKQAHFKMSLYGNAGLFIVLAALLAYLYLKRKSL